MIAIRPSAPAAIIFFFSFGLFGSKNFITSHPKLRRGGFRFRPLEIGRHIKPQTHKSSTATGDWRGSFRSCASVPRSPRLHRHAYRLFRSARLSHSFQLDRIDNKKLAAGFDVANKTANVLIRTFSRDAHRNSRINTLPLGVTLFLSG